ncbi:MAG: tripartite tricarboxylate transporter permease [Woeseiaceae bacterium]|nr:tripartite tricarboxylate transporter permease [Woeseiaceae bacterium]
MLDQLLIGLGALLDPVMLGAIAIGVIGGVIIGVLPGLTSTLGVALLIPVTFSMPPQAGLAMLGGIYVASTYSGAITAILLNIPGTPAAVATLLDGHPMSRNGQSTRALALATFGSSIGGLVSVLALLFLGPMLARLSLYFGPPEYFILAIFGITVIASLSAGAMEKGLIAGAIGLLISTVGYHPLTGSMRFTFDAPVLYDGIPLVAALIGLYSIPEVIDMVGSGRTKQGDAATLERRSPYSYLPETFRYKFNLLRSSVIGTLVGIVPGVGSSVAGFIAYDAAKRASKKPDGYGKGSPEGVLACETSNSAVTGGTLVPLMTLGIPGNPVTAVMLGGLLIHGLQPGAELFTSNASVSFGFILSLFVSNLLLVPVGLVFARYCVRVVQVPKSILAPVILLLSIIGTYSIRGSIDDIFVMFALGAIGFLCKIFAAPRAPLVLGLVLGTLAESELERSLALVQGDVGAFALQLVTRPISLVICILCIVALYQGIVQHRRGSKVLDS